MFPFPYFPSLECFCGCFFPPPQSSWTPPPHLSDEYCSLHPADWSHLLHLVVWTHLLHLAKLVTTPAPG